MPRARWGGGDGSSRPQTLNPTFLDLNPPDTVHLRRLRPKPLNRKPLLQPRALRS